ncbi:Hydroxymethylglutaryl-CoA synthase, cytoplasmic [Halotydeus destructor]|nr:Hydroxymethylglutaryl-CoA synthase, cytoplasmic [Halotydeus destructor]
MSASHVNGQNHVNHYPRDIGIIDLEMYFPSEYIEQSELEAYDGVSAGKYVIGLGQTRMGICSDSEDIHSLSLTVTKRLMEKAGVSPTDVGFLMVGTETILDKSKSVKSVLMQLFEECGNYNIQGLDTTNACFGGTAALHHSIDWMESSSWDGRYAIVVCGDIAIYAEGPARPTGGAGAVAMLIGPNAPLVIDRGVRTYYMRNMYDFYKPVLDSEYPTVDGQVSIVCYLQAAVACFQGFRKKFAQAVLSDSHEEVVLEDFDGLIFHAPYCKLVQKTIARLALIEFQTSRKPDYDGKFKGLEKYANYTIEDSLADRDFEKVFLNLAKNLFENKTKPYLLLATELGNMYTASVYSCLVSYLMTKSLSDMAGKRLCVFSYGSGLAASMFSIKISENSAPGSSLHKLYQGLRPCVTRLSNRIKISPEEFSKRMKEREALHNTAPFTPSEDLSRLYPGTYHLVGVDDKYRRTYNRIPSIQEHIVKPSAASMVNPVSQIKPTPIEISTNGHQPIST